MPKHYKGCCMMCAAGRGKIEGLGDATRMKASELRKFGKAKRINRHDVPADQQADRRGRVG